MTEVTPHPLKTQGFHHFFILLFYDHPANDVTIMKEGHPEAGIPLLVGGPGWNIMQRFIVLFPPTQTYAPTDKMSMR